MAGSVKTGDRLRLQRDWRGKGAFHIKGRPTGEFSCVLPRGTVLVSTQDAARFVFGFSCIPEPYDAMEAEMVPEEVRANPDYEGYSFIFFTGDLGSLLKPADETEPAAEE